VDAKNWLQFAAIYYAFYKESEEMSLKFPKTNKDINVYRDWNTNYTDLIFTPCICVLTYHSALHKYVQLLCINLKREAGIWGDVQDSGELRLKSH
jgi:hypothetical protein